MTTSQENHPTSRETESAISPGLQLRRARENRRISVETVAAELHVIPKVIEALERDDYAHLPSPVFVRGYLRNYARAVNMPPEPLIEIYNRNTDSNAAPAIPQMQDDASEERQVRWGLYLSVLGALAVLVLWGGSGKGLRFWESAPPAAESAATTPEEDSLSQGLAANSPAPESASGEAESPAPENPPANLETTPPVATVGVAPSATPIPTPAPTAGPEHTPVESQTPPRENVPVANPAPQPAEASETGQGPDTLMVRLSADSWVAIRDASGQRLVYGTLSAGTVRAIHGQAPFALVVGNSPAAQIEFNGQPVELLKHTKGLVSRMKVTK